ncbi:MAG: protein translocase subunit SecF [Treponema sp.]|nr:protein translocase subunit SecF [Treponema sp.]
MKKLYKFSKAFFGCAILSAILIVFGLVGLFTRGINFGIDFKPGLIEEVRIAPTAIELTYKGTATVSVDTTATGLDVIISGTGAENETRTFSFGQNPTVGQLAQSLNSIDGLTATAVSSMEADSYGIYTDSSVSSRLNSDVPYRLYVPVVSSEVTVETIREAIPADSIAAADQVQVKELGTASNRSYQVRAGAAADTTNEQLISAITSALKNKFGKDNVAIVKTDFVGSQFSRSLVGKSILLVAATMMLIWLYATVRFHWDFALGAIIALVHDSLIMITFVTWTQTEFSTTTLAAVLTIIGYSINATVVILDRVRENIKLVNTKCFNDILNRALSDTLTRSIITTVTTLFASISLLVFTTGSINDFAKVLTVGLISGCYSSLFISSGFISLMRRHWEPGEYANHVRPRKPAAGAVPVESR